MSKLVAFLAVTACLTLGCESAGPAPQAGVPQIGIVVVNNDAAPLRLSISTTAVELIGTAVPADIPGHSRANVLLTLPVRGQWALIVSRGPFVGSLFGSADIGDCTGVLPIEVKVEPGAEPVWEAPGVLC